MILGEGFGPALATKFIQGIADAVTRKVVNSQLEDKFGIDEATKVFLRATREERGREARKRAEEKERKNNETKKSVTQALWDSQENMTKLILDHKQ